MRATALGLLVGLAVWTAPVASAQTTVPERPGPPGVLFANNPSIVDPHSMPIESWSRVGNERALAVHFTTGTPECYGVHATVQETTENVTVELSGGTLPEAVGRACIMIAVFGTLEVPLQSPIGDRQVLSAH
ncbi:MAG TPA: hypothetical protein VHI10_16675 [Mycobacterium sp.]|nr:hypothetical protein [Mycobacterium sp.]